MHGQSEVATSMRTVAVCDSTSYCIRNDHFCIMQAFSSAALFSKSDHSFAWFAPRMQRLHQSDLGLKAFSESIVILTAFE